MADFFELRDISKHYPGVAAVDNVTVSLKRGEVFSLLGPSGCGKTTLLRISAGFEHPDSGSVILEGDDVTLQPPNKRQINTVFQNYALFPHLSVEENIAFGLRVKGTAKDIIKREVHQMLELMELSAQAGKKPGQISGGQKQRVAIARALILKPKLLLLDEPLAALDLKLRQRMLLELDRIHDEVGITFLYVTHDQGEAMSLSDRIAVMNHGKIEQIGTPAEIYETPNTSFVAAFIGDTNFVCGKVVELINGEYCKLDIEGFGEAICFNDKGLKPGPDEVTLSIRPEKFRVFAEKPDATNRQNLVRGNVEDVIYLGSQTKYWIRVHDYRIAVLQQHGRFLLDQKSIRWKDEVWLGWHADDGYMLQQYAEADEALLPVPESTAGSYETDVSMTTQEST
ncbi:MAG: ABC transporter ATP-binding protein [Verrucomicrobiota bacterium]|nr:ABC transporter ATP-binding protein [Verrucomicrobiota bacterium]